MNIEIKAKVNPTEDDYKVYKALKNIFPKIEFSMVEGSLVGGSMDIDDLALLKDLIDSQLIRDSARKAIKKGSRGSIIRFDLNKQAATVGKINFSSESPLGPINVRIRGDLNEICDYLAPSTL